MSAARCGRAARTSALTGILVVLGAVPAGAVPHAPALSAGCEQSGNRVTCTYTSPTPRRLTVDVPDGARTAIMSARGGAGGEGAFEALGQGFTSGASPGGAGGTAAVTIPVDDSKDLQVQVGGAGKPGTEGGAGGVGGGGDGSVGVIPNVFATRGGGGGGYSEIRLVGTDPATVDPLLAAGGGGGGGSGFFVGTPVITAGPGGAGGGLSGETAPGIGPFENDLLAGGGAGGSQTVGGLGGILLGSVPLIRGGGGDRGSGGAAPSLLGEGGGSGGGGGGGGYYGGGSGSLWAGGGGGSGFGPEGTQFGTGPAESAPFSAAALPDGEVVIIFVLPEVADEGPGQNPGQKPSPGESQGGGRGPCDDVSRLLISDRVPSLPAGC